MSLAASPTWALTERMVSKTFPISIMLTEQQGDLFLGHVHSTDGDVTIVAPRRILDADGLPSIDVTGAAPSTRTC